MAALAWGWNSQRQLEDVKTEYANKVAIANEGAKIATKALEIQHESAITRKNNEIKSISNAYAALSASLRQRPERPEPTIYTEAAPSCTGRELYKEDGEFLAREAARAERILAERDFYYERYEEVRKQLNGN